MKISYLVTWSSETNTLEELLSTLYSVLGTDELVTVQDTNITNPEGKGYIASICEKESQNGAITRTKVLEHDLRANYGEHKNYGIQQCTGTYIYQLDADELPSELTIGDNLHSLLESNPTIEAFAVPRINDFRGVTEEHAKQWGWRLTTSPTYNRPIVNWPDYQFRIFKREFPRISFLRRLHEKIEGYKSYVCLPAEEEYALYHNKTIEKQVETNLRYNKAFTQAENQGHNVFGK